MKLKKMMKYLSKQEVNSFTLFSSNINILLDILSVIKREKGKFYGEMHGTTGYFPRDHFVEVHYYKLVESTNSYVEYGED